MRILRPGQGENTMQIRTVLVAAAAVAWLFAGCSTDSVEEATPPPDSMRTCTADSDCVTYEGGCCDHCNGGYLFSVNKDSLQQAQAKHKASCGGGVACTLMGCANPVAVCESGLCAWKPGTL